MNFETNPVAIVQSSEGCRLVVVALYFWQRVHSQYYHSLIFGFLRECSILKLGEGYYFCERARTGISVLQGFCAEFKFKVLQSQQHFDTWFLLI